jgi:hypothetical protein
MRQFLGHAGWRILIMLWPGIYRISERDFGGCLMGAVVAGLCDPAEVMPPAVMTQGQVRCLRRD